MKNLYIRIPELQGAGSDVVLATVTGASGSTPQKPGSSALFNSRGLITGTVGGGIVEGKVTEFAVRASQTKKSGYLHLSLNNDISEKEQAICGGEILVLVDGDPFRHLPVFIQVSNSIARGEPGVLVTLVKEGGTGEVSVERYWTTQSRFPSLPSRHLLKIKSEAERILALRDREAYWRIDLPNPGKEPATICLLEPLYPSPHLVIAGAGHIGKALSHLGKMLDFQVTVIDDRSEYANHENLPDADNIIVGEIGSAIKEIDKSNDTYIIIVTRGHKDDAEALKSSIASAAGYVGMIGSRAKVAKMHSEFIDKGWATEDQWNGIFTPVGLDINSKTVEEIAVSIIAQVIQVKNRKK